MSLWSRLFRSSAGDLYEKGITYFNEGNYDRAVECLESVVAGEKSRVSPIAKLGAFYAAEAHGKLGLSEFHRGNLDKARAHFTAALAVNPHYPDLYYYLGVIHHQAGDPARAIDNLTRATELNPEYAEATCYLGLVLYESGYFDRANACFSRALELTRRAANPLSRMLVEKLHSRTFEHPLLAELKKAVVENSSFEARVKDGNFAFNRGKYRQAIVAFEDAVAIRPYPDLYCKLGLSYLESGGAEKASVCFSRALDQNPDYVEALYCLGVTHYQLQSYTKSCECLSRAAKLQPEYADIHCQLGVVWLALGEYEQARECLQRAVSISPGYPRAHYMLGLAMHALGEEDGASRELRTSLELNPQLFSLELDIGVQRMVADDWTEAVSYFEGVIERDPLQADALCFLGNAYIKKNRLGDAERVLSKALELNPDYVEAMKHLALVFFRRRHYDSAERLIEEALAVHQDYADLHKILGDIYLKTDSLNAARGQFEEALSINPDFSDAVQGLVVVLRRLGQGDDADRVLRKYLEKHPVDLTARTLLAHAMKLEEA